MWAYEGVHDATRISVVELSANELHALVKSVTSYKAEDTINYAFTTAPFSLENPLPQVSFLPLLASFLSTGFCYRLHILLLLLLLALPYVGAFDEVFTSSPS